MIDIKGLFFSYTKGKNVLRGINLKIQDGEFLGILGPNGSGKTTCLKCINRSLDVEKDRVFINGADICRMTRKEIAKIIAMVPQEVSYGFDFTGILR